MKREAELAEINPLAILDDGRMVALDGKMVTDDKSKIIDQRLKSAPSHLLSPIP